MKASISGNLVLPGPFLDHPGRGACPRCIHRSSAPGGRLCLGAVEISSRPAASPGLANTRCRGGDTCKTYLRVNTLRLASDEEVQLEEV